MNIAQLQSALQRLGAYEGAIDGRYGSLTRAGILKALTDGPDFALTETDFRLAAEHFDGDVAKVKAVYYAESTGSPFIDGRPTILFEPHRFSRATGRRYDASHPKISSRLWNKKLYPASQAGRWEQLLTAVGLDVDAGFASASYGGFQILGENYAVCGAPSPWAFAWRQAQTVADQLEAFVFFVKNTGLTKAFLQISGNPETCRAFSKGYNGTGYELNNHHGRIAEEYRKARL